MMIPRDAPPAVGRAMRLLAAYAIAKTLLAAIGALDGIFSAETVATVSVEARIAVTVIAVLVFGWFIGFYGVVIWKIGQGRNWSRYLLAVTFPISLLIDFAPKILGL